MYDRQQHVQNNVQINRFQWMNIDSSLSEFKYHIIIRKVYIAQGGFNQFTKNIYKHFRIPILPEAIHIVQILQTHQNLQYDLIIGFRRDIDAKNIFQKAPRFFIYGIEIPIQLAQAFKIYMTQRQLPLKKNHSESKYKKSSRSESSSSSENDRRHIKKERHKQNISISNSNSRSNSSKSKSRSQRSRSRSKHSASNERYRVIGRFYMMLTPIQWDKQYIEQQVLSLLKCKVDDIQIIQKRQDSLTFYILAIYSKQTYSHVHSIMSNFKIGQNYLLLIRQQEIIQNGLKQQLKKYQFKAFKYSNNNYTQKTFEEFINLINNFKDFQINILHIFQQENYYIVTTQMKINNILKLVRLNGWKLEQAYLHSKFVVTLEDRWNQYNKKSQKY